ncbi:MAG: PAS domain-containing protein [Alphaproteobacteria bacterium]|nr:PAS domain-containing protein [Alphaproteobacteria bacterium]
MAMPIPPEAPTMQTFFLMPSPTSPPFGRALGTPVDFSRVRRRLGTPLMTNNPSNHELRYRRLAVTAIAAGVTTVVAVIADLFLIDAWFEEEQEPLLDALAAATALVAIAMGIFSFSGLRRQMGRDAATAAENRSSLTAVSERLREALDHVSDGIALWDKDGRFVTANRRFIEMFGSVLPHFAPGRHWRELARVAAGSGRVPAAVGREESWVDELGELMAVGRQAKDLRTSHGLWLRFQNFSTPDGGIVSVRTDISDLKEREQALAQSEARFRDFAETAGDWLWETDKNHRFTYHSGSDRAPNTPLGLTRWQAAQVSDPGADPLWRQHVEAMNQHQPVRDFHYRTQWPDRRNLYLRVSGKPIFDDDGRFLGYRGSATDETATVEALERVQHLEAQLLSTIEGMPVGVSLYDAEDRLVMWNSRAAEIARITGANEYHAGQSFEEILRAAVAKGAHDVGAGVEDIHIQERLKRHRKHARARSKRSTAAARGQGRPIGDGGARHHRSADRFGDSACRRRRPGTARADDDGAAKSRISVAVGRRRYDGANRDREPTRNRPPVHRRGPSRRHGGKRSRQRGPRPAPWPPRALHFGIPG